MYVEPGEPKMWRFWDNAYVPVNFYSASLIFRLVEKFLSSELVVITVEFFYSINSNIISRGREMHGYTT